MEDYVQISDSFVMVSSFYFAKCGKHQKVISDFVEMLENGARLVLINAHGID